MDEIDDDVDPMTADTQGIVAYDNNFKSFVSMSHNKIVSAEREILPENCRL